MALPGAGDFFLPQPNPELSQGDIILVPTITLWDEQRGALDFSQIRSSPSLGDSILVPLWDSYNPKTGAPLVNAEARWSPAIIVSHSCEIDKEFNREVSRLLNAGADAEEARSTAALDPNLDKLVVVSPVLPYDEAPEDQRAGIRSGDRIGMFAIPPAPIFDDEDFYVDLRRLTTVDRLLALRYKTLASLTPQAAGVLRYKVSEAYASRALALISEVEALTDRVVVRTEMLPKDKNNVSLALHLDNGEILHLIIRKPLDKVREAVSRIMRI